MCGIVGFSGTCNSASLIAGKNALLHRGPDGSGIFQDEKHGIGLGHTRLSIIDLSTNGHQPMQTEDGSVVITYNGEIYNFQELRQELSAKGFSFRGHSDTEVLLNLYVDRGEAMLSKLNGIFAFAIWDSRRKNLFIARDGMGVKPLYYSSSDKIFAFASEIKALHHLVPDQKELDPKAIHRYLSFLWCPGAGTPLKSIRKMLPGEAMIVHENEIKRRWTWYRSPTIENRTSSLDSVEAIDGVRTYLRQAVQRQMVADVPVGAFLSGGLDSSSIAAFAHQFNPDIRCFTIQAEGGGDAGEIEDLPFAQKAASHLGLRLEVVNIDPVRMANDIENMIYTLDEPLADPASLNVKYISQLARSNGMKVLLSGAGGDDLFTGYRRHQALQFDALWDWIPKSLTHSMAKRIALLSKKGAVGRRLNRLFSHAMEESDTRLAGYFAWARESDLRALYSPYFLAELEGAFANQPLIEYLAEMPEGLSKLQKILALEQRFFLADHNLIYTDKMSMAAGVEVRVPFLDPDLVDFASTIPNRFKQRGLTGKWVLKKAMEPFLPQEIIYRSKTGFGAPLRRWLRHELRDMLNDFLSPQSLQNRGLFNPTMVQKLIADNQSGRVDAAYTLFSILCVEIWCRRFVDNPISATPAYGNTL